MQQLNLPPVDIHTRIVEGKYEIFDCIRKKYLRLTPEEWVRQHIICYLLQYHNYSRGLFNIEGGLRYNRLLKRTDILVYDLERNPYLLIECKSFEITLNQKVIEQAAVYNKKLKAPFLMITNGIKHYCCSLDADKNQYAIVDGIPGAPVLQK